MEILTDLRLNTRRSLFAAFLLASISLPGVSFAADDYNEARVVRRETTAEKITAKTAQKAELRKALEGQKKVTFQDVLKDPDNADLNFQYSKTQVMEGDLLGATGTLERILAVKPDWHEVRLFYTVVLFRLDDLTEAQQQIEMLDKAPLSPRLSEERDLYKNEIKKRKKKTRFSVRETIGMEGDTNRNAAPSSKELLLFNTRTPNSVDGRRKSDTAFLNIASVDVSHDLGFQAGHLLIGSFTHYLQNQNALNSLDLGAFQYEVGGVYKTRYVNFTPTFFASHVFLSDENYLRTQGGNFSFDHTFRDRWDVSAAYRVERQDYLPIKENEVARTRNGMEHSVTSGVSYILTSSMKVGGGVVYSYKNAKANYEGYDHWAYRIGHSWLLGRGQFLLNAVEAGFDRYDEQDSTVATRFRRDNSLRYRVTYGAPLSFFFMNKLLPKFIKDIVLSFNYEYYRAYSNIPNYAYSNSKFQGLLTKKWEF